MPDWSRRDLFRASAGAAAVAVPMAALAGTPVAAAAAARSAGTGVDADAVDGGAESGSFGSQPVMFCVHDPRRGEVSILHGTREVVVHDRQLVARILQAARAHGAR